MPSKRSRSYTFLAAGAAACALGAAAARSDEGRVLIGERPAIAVHVDEAKVESGSISFKELFHRGQILFDARFNRLDGQGRPASTGDGRPRGANQPPFIRTSGPDSNSCFGCHNQPRSGGGGDFVANVFVLAQERDPVVTTLDPRDSNERNTVGLFGSGAIEMLAREMTTELVAIRTAAIQEARDRQAAVRRELVAKGVPFGVITVFPDGRVDPRGIDGVDWDLIVKPFHQKGVVVSLREFSNTAMNHHHGLQSVERFGAGVDADKDGVVDELTVGDITAVTVYQAALPVPGRRWPRHPERRAAAERGERLFLQVGCPRCHVPEMTLESPLFTEPNPYNPPGNVRPEDVKHPYSFDMSRDGPGPRLERLADGRARLRAFTDLKRHDISDAQYNHFANERVAQGTLAGFASAAAFTQPPRPRPVREFLTRRLWDAGRGGPYGHRGDLTTLTEAINFHGGEARPARDAFFHLSEDERSAIVEFLKTLDMLPEGSPRVITEQVDE